MPDVTPIRLRRDARQLRIGVVHVEDLVSQDRFENRPRLRIVVDQLAIDLEPPGRRFLGDVQEREQAVIRLPFDAEIVEAVAAGQRVATEQHPTRVPSAAQQRRAAFAE